MPCAARTDLRSTLEKMQVASAAREAELMAKLDALLRRRFGKSSEKMPPPAKELRKERWQSAPQARKPSGHEAASCMA